LAGAAHTVWLSWQAAKNWALKTESFPCEKTTVRARFRKHCSHRELDNFDAFFTYFKKREQACEFKANNFRVNANRYLYGLTIKFKILQFFKTRIVEMHRTFHLHASSGDRQRP
jgi:hypothetical protein